MSITKIGCHVSIGGGIQNAPQRAAELGCEIFQLFTRSPRGGAAPKITNDVAFQFKAEMEKWKQENCYIHTPYYINFASSNSELRKAAVRICREELERGSIISAKYIMTHLGSSTSLTASGSKFTQKDALDLVARGVAEVLKGYRGSTQFLLEISAGAGNIIGDTFEELGCILEKADRDIGICVDTAHMFASGYDIKTEEGFREVVKKIESTVGLEKVKLVHANDSKIELGGRKDRHDHIGDGKIGREGFVHMMKQFPRLDFILETEHDKVREDLAALKLIRKDITANAIG